MPPHVMKENSKLLRGRGGVKSSVIPAAGTATRPAKLERMVATAETIPQIMEGIMEAEGAGLANGPQAGVLGEHGHVSNGSKRFHPCGP